MPKAASKKDRGREASGLRMLSVYVDDQLFARVQRCAEKEGRKLAQMGRRLFEEALDSRDAKESALGVAS